MEMINDEYYDTLVKVRLLLNYINDEILEEEQLSAADLLDALASSELRLAFDSDDVIPGVYARLMAGRG